MEENNQNLNQPNQAPPVQNPNPEQNTTTPLVKKSNPKPTISLPLIIAGVALLILIVFNLISNLKPGLFDNNSTNTPRPTEAAKANQPQTPQENLPSTPRSIVPYIVTPSPISGPYLDTLITYAVPDGWSVRESDAAMIKLQSPKFVAPESNTIPQGQEINIIRIPGSSLEAYKTGPFASASDTTHDGIPATITTFSYTNTLSYNYSMVKSGYAWTITYHFYSPDSYDKEKYQKEFNNFIDNFHFK